MYEISFQLARRPFAAAPTAAAYVRTATHQAALENLVRCVERAEGVGLVVGPAGSGKSLILQLLAAGFRDRFQVAMLNSAQLCTRKALLQSILFELKLPYRDQDEGELRLSLLQQLEPREGGPLGLLLLVDEAHTLPQRLLEELRQLTNVVRNGQPRVRLILAGNASLDERLANPKLESFQQRLASRCYLQHLTRDETLQYVREQIAQCGGQADRLFAPDALDAIFTATDGIPRLINQLCDHALVLAALGGHRQLNAAGIQEAWADLQQLPLPWNEKSLPAAAESTGSIIEFGELNDAETLEPGLQVMAPLPDVLTSSAATSATQLLDQIDDEIASLDLPEGELLREMNRNQFGSDFSPLTAGNTEVEVTFHYPDPFGQGFEEEEVVIDRYASLEAAAFRNRPRVRSEEGRELAVALFGAEELKAVVPPQIARTEPEPIVQPILVKSEPVEIREEWLSAATSIEEPIPASPRERSPAANDPVYPEPLQEEAPGRRATVPLHDVGTDDRDLIIIEEEAPRRKTHVGTGKPKRHDYRQLFSNLRRR
jgi:type II secretory pathway predicted ATPase ExeA